MNFIKTILCLFLVIITFTQISFGQEITISDSFIGYSYRQNDNKLRNKHIPSVISDSKEALRIWQKSKRKMQLSWGLIFGGFGIVGAKAWHDGNQKSTNSNNPNYTEPNSTVYIVGVLISGLGGGGLRYYSYALKRKSILTYNTSLDKNKGLSSTLNLQPTRNGLGLVLNF